MKDLGRSTTQPAGARWHRRAPAIAGAVWVLLVVATVGAVEADAAAAADLAVTKQGSPNPVAPGADETYTITISNNGPSDAQNVVLQDALPTGMSLVSEMPNPSNPDTFTNTSTGNTASFNSSVMLNGDTDTFTVVAQVSSTLPQGTMLTNTATGSSDTHDPNPSNNSGSATTTVSAPNAGTPDFPAVPLAVLVGLVPVVWLIRRRQSL